MKVTKYPKYQDYVIKDGKLIGEFDEMYKDFPDPWEQSTREVNRSEKIIAIHLLKSIKAKKIIELGCGLGHYTDRIRKAGFTVLGVDISETAIKKAKAEFPRCNFHVGDILDFHIYEGFRPDAIVMPEITWYILDKLDAYLDFLHSKMPEVYLLHLLTVYPPGVQKYGCEKFTDLPGILAYFGMNYCEWGEIGYADFHGAKRTYFLGRYL